MNIDLDWPFIRKLSIQHFISERVRHIQERLEEFIKSLNSERE